jgi:hypothetical protein
MAVSSAKVATVVCLSVGKSAVYNRYKTGPSTLPCGTPDSISTRDVYSSSYFTWKYLSLKYDLMI